MAWTDGLGKYNSVSSSCRAFRGSSVDGQAFDLCLQRVDSCLAERSHAMLSGTRIKPPELDEFFNRRSAIGGIGVCWSRLDGRNRVGVSSEGHGRDEDCSSPTGSPEAVARSHRTWRADLPHYALRQLVHRIARTCSFPYGRRMWQAAS